jgi:hypothetical protein
MAKAVRKKTAIKPKSKKEQYERFQQTARDLGIDNDKSAKAFELTFRKIVPSRSNRSPSKDSDP